MRKQLHEVTEERDILARAVSFLRQGDPMTTRCREFIAAEKRAGGNVVIACDLLQLSRCAFYTWHEHVPSKRALSDAELTEKIRAVHSASKGTYGAPRVQAELTAQGLHVGRKRWPGSWPGLVWPDGAGGVPGAPPS